MNYEEDIKIDPDQLDIEWLEQPSLFMKYSHHLAMVRKTLDESKQTLDIARAETDKKIRDNPAKYLSDGKVTETAVSNAVLKHPMYQEAYSNYLEAKYEADMAQGAVNAFDHRKTALENLVRLFGQQYFAGPKLPRNLSQEWQENKSQKMANSVITMSRKNKN